MHEQMKQMGRKLFEGLTVQVIHKKFNIQQINDDLSWNLQQQEHTWDTADKAGF
jgi:hypothetical protein